MTGFRNLSLRGKQMLVIMLTSSVVLLLACTAFGAYEVATFRRTRVQELATLADITANSVTSALEFNVPASAVETLSALRAEPAIMGACVYRLGGEIFATYDRDGDGIVFSPPAVPAEVRTFERQRLALSRVIMHQGEAIGTVYLESDRKALTARLVRYAGIVGLVFGASLLVALVLSNRLQRLVSDPILELAQAARTVALEKDYSARVSRRSNDEVGQLVDGFNEMLAQIQSRDASLEASRNNLEQRVNERTGAWERLNLVLQKEVGEHQRAAESLRLLGSAVEQSRESILITDAELDLPGPSIIFSNPAFTQMTGYAASEVAGKTPRLLQGPRTDKAVLKRLRENLACGEAFSGETVNYRKDGTEFILEWQVAPIRNVDGVITHFVAIQRDITESKRLKAKLFQAQKMETVGKLAGGVAHEFNSILTAIIGQTELMLTDLPEGHPLRLNAAEILKAARRAGSLTHQLLAYGGKQLLQPSILDLNSVLAELAGTLRLLMGAAVEVRIHPDSGLKPVKADASQIEEVIVNLVLNAGETMPHGGKLTLATSNVTLEPETAGPNPDMKPGAYVLLAITDTGLGMTAETSAHLFEPFYSAKGVGEGTGLGLSTCYGIIKQSGGHIDVMSEPGRGTTFKVYLPQSGAGPGSMASPQERSELPRGTETILLVEDDPAWRDLATNLLKRLGYNVLPAASGAEALELLGRTGQVPVDLLFTDLVMPGMNGEELAGRVRVLFPAMRILFTTAYSRDGLLRQGLSPEALGLLPKPYTPSALARKVREVLDA